MAVYHSNLLPSEYLLMQNQKDIALSKAPIDWDWRKRPE
jgi:hypothetical protein